LTLSVQRSRSAINYAHARTGWPGWLSRLRAGGSRAKLESASPRSRTRLPGDVG